MSLIEAEVDPKTEVHVEAVEVPGVRPRLLDYPSEYLHERYAEGNLCCAFFFISEYCVVPRVCIAADIFTNDNPPYCCFPCLGVDYACPHGLADDVYRLPVSCTLIPCLPSPTLYPDVACFPTVAEVAPGLYPDDPARQRLGVDKRANKILCSMCIPYACASNTYLVEPIESLWVRETEACCVYALCSLPMLPRHPIALSFLGATCYPRFACCPKAIDMFPEKFAHADEMETRPLV
uniref:Uncharacterized protein n=1 Tax=Pinguiococcus pyrenoidosus TaxID=172671 RepID=A0A7R9U1X9_9STRA|mmetsp:Transcript_11177/g.41736  ORF Transcript_11177/g.41736 Transcript_11177/m.41736 type:complete len:236 (+) Transcript_11177:91-798(+)